MVAQAAQVQQVEATLVSLAMLAVAQVQQGGSNFGLSGSCYRWRRTWCRWPC